MYSLLHTEVNNNYKRLKTSLSNETCLWHLCLVVITLNMIQRLVNDGPLSFLKVELLLQDEFCLEGKMNEDLLGLSSIGLKGYWN